MELLNEKCDEHGELRCAFCTCKIHDTDAVVLFHVTRGVIGVHENCFDERTARHRNADPSPFAIRVAA